jgi:nitrate reductase cytochrome c-type subunit
MSYYWLECFVPDDEASPAIKNAWEQYKIISGLSK